MFANWTLENTATTGTGTITLSGVPSADFVPFSASCADGELVRYAIKDGDNREIGQGVYTLSGNTLSRALIEEKLQAGVLTRYPATGLSLSGTAMVGFGATAQNTAYDSSSQLIAKRFISHHIGNISGASGLGTDVVRAVPFVLTRAIKLTALGINVNTPAAAGKKARIAIAHPGLTDVGKILAETGDIAVDSSGYKAGTLATPVALNPGCYDALIVSNGDPTVAATTSAYSTCTSRYGIIDANNYTHAYKWGNAGWTTVAGAIPAGAWIQNANAFPVVYMENA